MPVVVHCPTCSGPLRVADELIGRKVRCPSCSAVFNAPAPPPVAEQPDLPLEQSPPVAPKPDVPIETVPIEPWKILDLSLDAPAPVPEAPLAQHPVGAVEIAHENAPPPRDDRRAPRRDEEDRRPCPGCDRLLANDARRCPSCGLQLPNRPSRRDERNRDIGPPVRRDAEPHRGSAILVMGIMSVVALFPGCALLGIPWLVGLILGIVAWIMGSADLAKMRNGDMDPEGHSNTQAGWICGIIGTVMNTLVLLTCGTVIGFAIWAETQQSQKRPKWAAPPGAVKEKDKDVEKK